LTIFVPLFALFHDVYRYSVTLDHGEPLVRRAVDIYYQALLSEAGECLSEYVMRDRHDVCPPLLAVLREPRISVTRLIRFSPEGDELKHLILRLTEIVLLGPSERGGSD
jgi:hypothetical protein